MVPNHLFQLLSLVTMEPPSRFEAGGCALREGRGARRCAGAERGGGAAQFCARAVYPRPRRQQFDRRLSTPNVRPDSTTETYAALKLQIDNWRWAGVPFFLRTGKALETRVTEVAIKFKQAPFAM